MEEAKKILIQILVDSKRKIKVGFNVSGNSSRSEIIFTDKEFKTLEEAQNFKNEFWEELINWVRNNFV